MLALIQGEPGSEVVAAVLDTAVMHSVNAFEVLRKLTREGVPADTVASLLDELNILIVEDVPAIQVKSAGPLLAQAEKLGLSLGDCVCLLLGERMNAVILTAEKRWSNVRLQAGEVRQIR